MEPVGLANTKISTDYAQNPPRSLVCSPLFTQFQPEMQTDGAINVIGPRGRISGKCADNGGCSCRKHVVLGQWGYNNKLCFKASSCSYQNRVKRSYPLLIGNFYEKLERRNTHSGVNSLWSRCVQKFGEKAIGRCCYFVNELSNTGTLSPSHSSRKEVDVILSTVIPSTFTLDFGYWCYFSPLAQVLSTLNPSNTCQMHVTPVKCAPCIHLGFVTVQKPTLPLHTFIQIVTNLTTSKYVALTTLTLVEVSCPHWTRARQL